MKTNDWLIVVVGKIHDRPNQVRYQRLAALAAQFNVITITSAELPEKLRNLSEQVIVKERAISTWLEVIRCARALKRSARKYGVYTQYTPNSLIAGYLCKRICGAPWVYDLWDHPSLSWSNLKGVKRWLRILRWKCLLGPMLRNTSVRVVGMHPGILSYVPPPAGDCPIILTGPGYDDETQSEIQTQAVPGRNGNIRLVYVSALSKMRGLQHIHKWVRLYKGPVVQLDIAGKALDRESAALLDEIRIEARTNNCLVVNIHGEIGAQEAQELVAASDIGMFLVNDAVINYRYAFPVKVIEYLSYGLVCVAMETNGVRSIIDDNVNGILCGRDYQSWADALQRAILMFSKGENEKLQRMKINALKSAKNRNWKRINEKLVKDLVTALR